MNLEQLEKWDIIYGDYPDTGSVGKNRQTIDISMDKEFGKSPLPEKKELIIKCQDNCSCISIDTWTDEEEYYISFYRSYKESFWRRFKNVFKYLFLGQNLISSDTILTKEDFMKIKEF